MHDLIWDAIEREKQIKNRKRQWKINLIERDNPGWVDLYYGLSGCDENMVAAALKKQKTSN